jgi:hypothetical protein
MNHHCHTDINEIYKNLSTNNTLNESALYEIKNLNNSLNKAEDILRAKILLRYQELDILNKEYNSIVETYSQIIRRSLIK